MELENVVNEEEGEEEEEEARDRLSSLPTELIHNILSFLSISDVFRMHSLSKRWKTMWLDIPFIKFIDEFKFANKFCITHDLKCECSSEYDVVGNCLNRRCNSLSKKKKKQQQQQEVIVTSSSSHNNNINITSFKLYTLFADHGIGLEDIYYWLNSVSKTNTLEELDLAILHTTCGIRAKYIPESVLLNVRSSLTLLKLGGLSLDPNCGITLPSLTTLSLIDPSFEDATIFENLISRCPKIKSLHLGGNNFILNKKNNNESLFSSSFFCASLTSLSLDKYLGINDSSLENLIFGLPLLERLTLDSCDELKEPNIHSQSLKSFYLYHGDNEIWKGATLDTPNLVEFNYNGPVSSIFNINSTNLLQVNLSLLGNYCYTGQNHTGGWYLYLILFLSSFKCSSSTTLRLYLQNFRDLLVPQNIKKICNSPLPHLKHLKVRKMYCNSYHSGPSTNDDFWIPSESSRAALLWWAPSAETLEIEL